jgi:aminomethyltransferase
MSLLTTPLDALHRELGAKMVPFAGYDMPVQYPTGIIKEHLHTRAAAGLFDVSHMGQVIIEGQGAADRLESLVPVDIQALGIDRQTYALFTNDRGGVLDDLIITRWCENRFFLVLNALQATGYRPPAGASGWPVPDGAGATGPAGAAGACRPGSDARTLPVLEQQALLALQGPAAREVIRELCPGAAELVFMQGCRADIEGVEAYITCSGYTGEDGFEISVAADRAEHIARALLSSETVHSLRLEAGLCLYGHELSTEIDPIQAGLMWSISRARRADGARPGGFPGADVILQRMVDKPPLRRVGLVVDGRRPMREGQEVLDSEGRRVGSICSACYGSSVGKPIAMAYVERDSGEVGTSLQVAVRDKLLPVTVTAMPFVPQRYFRG